MPVYFFKEEEGYMFKKNLFFLFLALICLFEQGFAQSFHVSDILAKICRNIDKVSENDISQIYELLTHDERKSGIINLNSKRRRKLMLEVEFKLLYWCDKVSQPLVFKGLRDFLDFLPKSKRILDQNKECPICKDFLRCRVKPSCGHEFCRSCLMEWFAGDRYNTLSMHSKCPICRKLFNKKTIKILKSGSEYMKFLSDNLEKRHHQFQEQIAQDAELAMRMEDDSLLFNEC